MATLDNNPFDNKNEHDRYLRKNQALSRAYDIDKQDKVKYKKERGEVKHDVGVCNKCKETKPVLPYYLMQTGYFEGVTSVSKEMVKLCDDCSPNKKKKENTMSHKQITALMRGVKKGRL